jgi:hypothetical protein
MPMKYLKYVLGHLDALVNVESIVILQEFALIQWVFATFQVFYAVTAIGTTDHFLNLGVCVICYNVLTFFIRSQAFIVRFCSLWCHMKGAASLGAQCIGTRKFKNLFFSIFSIFGPLKLHIRK